MVMVKNAGSLSHFFFKSSNPLRQLQFTVFELNLPIKRIFVVTKHEFDKEGTSIAPQQRLRTGAS